VAQDSVRELRWQMRTAERRMLLIIGDLMSAIIATMAALALWSRFDYLALTEEFVRVRAGWFVLLPAIWPILMINFYDIRRASSWNVTVRGIFLAALVGALFYLGIYFFRTEAGSLPRRGPIYFLVLTVALTLIWRFIYIRIFTGPAFMRRVLIVGAGQSGREILSVVHELNPSPFHVVGFVDDDPAKQGTDIDSVEVIGDCSKLEALIQEQHVSDIVVAITGSMNGAMFQALLDAQERWVEIIRMPVLYEELLGRVPIQHLESDWLLRSFVDEVRVSSLYAIMKRLVDLAGAILGLVFLGIVFPWVAVAILVESGRPILFSQTRMGRGGKVYRICKFRTMWQDAEADGIPIWSRKDDPRMTRVGRMLRKMHIDEFPQFINVLVGDMSLVGPRPERPELVAELEEQIPFYRARLLAKPGLSGWAQVNYGKGGSVAGSAEKLEFDLYYIKHRGFFLDMWIIARSIGEIIGFRGV
jgi:exopolysaccharide biosynthesis polyprenyl glycosylphosphotransferase